MNEEKKNATHIDKIINEVLIMLRKYDLTSLNQNKYGMKYIIVEYSVNKIDDVWKDSEFYISTNYDSIIEKEKYLWSRIDLLSLSDKIKKPPDLYFDHRGELCFENGNYNFANLRDLGCKTIPCIIEEKEKEKMDLLLK
jgi:hypothetical protein